MNDKENEALSALMDGELDEMALRRTLNQLDDEPELKQTWSRYHLQRDTIKGDISAFSTLDISGAISAAIDDEAALEGIKQPSESKPWWKAVAGLSVAASVALAVVIGARFNPLVETQGVQQLASKTQVKVVTPEITLVKGPSMIAQSNSELEGVDEKVLQQAQERLNSYLKQHAQDSALGQGRTAMPFARVVNFETTSKQVKGN
ncbi:MAG: sigma-E factor negative regulatory protein [Bermanella sp.]